MATRTITRVFLCIIALSFYGGCASVSKRTISEEVTPLVPEQELRDEQLLNVAISVFDPGELPEDAEEQGLSQQIREAEARFMPVHLKHTLQRSGYWGAVRVVPDKNEVGAEVLVTGNIDYSDGERVTLTIEAKDARNAVWFRRTYSQSVSLDDHESITPEKEDAFQDLFNAIANDLALHRATLSPDEVDQIRAVAELRFARSMAPDAFSDYLTEDKDGAVRVVRLPARNDTMMERVRAVKTRDEMLVDTINDYYDLYYRDLWDPYADWRKFRHKESETLKSLERQALTKQIAGVAAIIGGIVLAATTDMHGLEDLVIAGGAYSVYSGHQTRQESKINKEVIEELGESFASEAEPLVIEVKGETVRLTGSAEEQYAAWRRLLKHIYAKETGLPQTGQEYRQDLYSSPVDTDSSEQ